MPTLRCRLDISPDHPSHSQLLRFVRHPETEMVALSPPPPCKARIPFHTEIKLPTVCIHTTPTSPGLCSLASHKVICTPGPEPGPCEQRAEISACLRTAYF